MNTKLFTISTIHLLFSLVIGIVFLYLTFVIVRWLFRRRKLPTETKNVAFGIFVGAMMFTVGYILSGIFEPAVATAQILMKNNIESFSFVLEFMKHLGLFLLIGTFATVIVIFTAIRVFDLFTATIDEFREISEGNVSVAIVLSSMIIVVALLAKTSIMLLIESIVPFPDSMQLF